MHDFQKCFKIIRLKKNVFSSAARIHDVVPRPRKFNAKWSAYSERLILDIEIKANGRPHCLFDQEICYGLLGTGKTGIFLVVILVMFVVQTGATRKPPL